MEKKSIKKPKVVKVFKVADLFLFDLSMSVHPDSLQTDLSGAILEAHGALEGERGVEVAHSILALLRDSNGLLATTPAKSDPFRKITVSTKGHVYQATIHNSRIHIFQTSN